MVTRVNRLSKSLSAAMCVGSYSLEQSMCDPWRLDPDRDARNQFLRYVFHELELRVPLNTVSLSIDELCARENDEDFSMIMSSCELLHHASAQVTDRE